LGRRALGLEAAWGAPVTQVLHTGERDRIVETVYGTVYGALLGGALIGLAATILWFGTGVVAGASGILRNALTAGSPRRGVDVAFIVGLLAVGLLSLPTAYSPENPACGWGLIGLGGLLVGFGTRLGGGCTSGHGVCGLSRISTRSLVATATFIATGGLTVAITSHVLQ
jgi:uncharacterized membrane protein YedE/YeeE